MSDALRVVRAISTNQIARFFPSGYVRLTGQTGRGDQPETMNDVVHYIWRCVDDYLGELGLDRETAGTYLNAKRVLEYGPGDLPGVALVLIGLGAGHVTCVDRFELLRFGGKNTQILEGLLASMPTAQCARAAKCFNIPGVPASGLRAAPIQYITTPSGLSGACGTADLIISRAVLEHVDNLPATSCDMQRALADKGVALHLVDLRSHNLHRANPLDFLEWPATLWRWMYSHKGVPNQLRPGDYRQAIDEAGLETILMEPTGRLEKAYVDEIRPTLAEPFHSLSDEDLSWLGFWLVVRRKPPALRGESRATVEC